MGIELNPGMPVQLVRLLLVLNAAQDAGLALAQADHLVHHALAQDRLGHAADGHRAALRSDLDLDLQRHIVVVVDGGRHFDIYAHVRVLELGVDQRADHRGGRARLVGTGGDGDFFADLHGRLLPVGGADARILQNLGVVESVSSRLAVAAPTVTAKSVAFRWERS